MGPQERAAELGKQIGAQSRDDLRTALDERKEQDAAVAEGAPRPTTSVEQWERALVSIITMATGYAALRDPKWYADADEIAILAEGCAPAAKEYLGDALGPLELAGLAILSYWGPRYLQGKTLKDPAATEAKLTEMTVVKTSDILRSADAVEPMPGEMLDGDFEEFAQ